MPVGNAGCGKITNLISSGGGSTRRLEDPLTVTIDLRLTQAHLAPNRSQHPTLLQVQMPKTNISDIKCLF